MVEWLTRGINIKNDEAFRLAHELADATGESLTAAVTEAVRERLTRVRGKQGGLAQRLMVIGGIAPRTSKSGTDLAIMGNLLYDERGLPR
ncbi:MAG: type II toxin-antitoxin system VapB family antitoxin [Chloroflexota bacterium]